MKPKLTKKVTRGQVKYTLSFKLLNNPKNDFEVQMNKLILKQLGKKISEDDALNPLITYFIEAQAVEVYEENNTSNKLELEPYIDRNTLRILFKEDNKRFYELWGSPLQNAGTYNNIVNIAKENNTSLSPTAKLEGRIPIGAKVIISYGKKEIKAQVSQYIWSVRKQAFSAYQLKYFDKEILKTKTWQFEWTIFEQNFENEIYFDESVVIQTKKKETKFRSFLLKHKKYRKFADYPFIDGNEFTLELFDKVKERIATLPLAEATKNQYLANYKNLVFAWSIENKMVIPDNHLKIYKLIFSNLLKWFVYRYNLKQVEPNEGGVSLTQLMAMFNDFCELNDIKTNVTSQKTFNKRLNQIIQGEYFTFNDKQPF